MLKSSLLLCQSHEGSEQEHEIVFALVRVPNEWDILRPPGRSVSSFKLVLFLTAPTLQYWRLG